MRSTAEVLCLSLLLVVRAAVAVAGPVEEANASIDRWSAAYNSNDPDAVARMYTPDAILLGTVSPVISKGTDENPKLLLDDKRKRKQEYHWRKAHNTSERHRGGRHRVL